MTYYPGLSQEQAEQVRETYGILRNLFVDTSGDVRSIGYSERFYSLIRTFSNIEIFNGEDILKKLERLTVYVYSNKKPSREEVIERFNRKINNLRKIIGETLINKGFYSYIG